MSDAYAFARGRVAAKIRQWNTGVVTLTRTSTEEPEPETPWIPGTPTTVTYTLDAVVKGVTADSESDDLIQATEEVVVASPKARDSAGAVVDIDPRTTDTLEVDGAVRVIKKIEAIPAAGDPAVFHIFIAS